MATLAFVLRVSVGTILLAAALSKARNISGFIAGIRGYRLLPTHFARTAAFGVVAGEIVAATILISGVFVASGFAVATFLFALFTVALATNLARGENTSCHCFGASTAELISATTVVRSVLLLGLSAFGVAIAGSDPGSPASSETLPRLTVAAGLVIFVRLCALLPEAWKYLKTPVPAGRTPVQRMTFRYQPVDRPGSLTAASEIATTTNGTG